MTNCKFSGDSTVYSATIPRDRIDIFKQELRKTSLGLNVINLIKGLRHLFYEAETPLSS